MDLGSLIPVVVIALGIPGVVSFMYVILGHARKMKELQIREKQIDADAELGRVVEALSDEVHDTRTLVAELQERLDFAERVLTRGRDDVRADAPQDPGE